MKAVILAGGQGTRLQSVCKDIPKAMVKVADRPVLYRQLDLLQRNGFQEVIIVIGYKGDTIRALVGDGRKWQMKVSYCEDDGRVGTTQALLNVADQLTEPFLLMFGDLVTNCDLLKLRRFWGLAQKGASILVVHPNNHPHDSDLVEAHLHRIVKIHPSPHPDPLPARNMVFAGIAILSPELLALAREVGGHNIAKHVLPKLVDRVPIYWFWDTGYLKDIGTPERLDQADRELRYTRAFAFSNQPTVFLDRDGVINDGSKFVNSPDDFKLLDKAGDAIRALHNSGYRVVCITNQGGITLGYLTEEMLEQIHIKMDSELAKAGTYLDATYHCPHYSESDDEGCDCRKPNTGMIEQASRDFHIDKSVSWMVGNEATDIECGRRAGLKTCFVGPDWTNTLIPATERFPNLSVAAAHICARKH
jgi:histidinol-phosphate phosphatase family protein